MTRRASLWILHPEIFHYVLNSIVRDGQHEVIKHKNEK